VLEPALPKLISAVRASQVQHINLHLPHIRNLGWIVAAVVFCLIMGRIRGGPFR
jgi:hypothetical protein